MTLLSILKEKILFLIFGDSNFELFFIKTIFYENKLLLFIDDFCSKPCVF